MTMKFSSLYDIRPSAIHMFQYFFFHQVLFGLPIFSRPWYMFGLCYGLCVCLLMYACLRWWHVLWLNARTDQVDFWYEDYHRQRLLRFRCGSGSAHGKEDLPGSGVLDFRKFMPSPIRSAVSATAELFDFWRRLSLKVCDLWRSEARVQLTAWSPL